MRTVFLAAAAALSLGPGGAYADSGDGSQAASTLSKQIPGAAARADLPVAPTYTQNRDVRTSRGPWLFPPIGKYLDQQAGG